MVEGNGIVLICLKMIQAHFDKFSNYLVGTNEQIKKNRSRKGKEWKEKLGESFVLLGDRLFTSFIVVFTGLFEGVLD